MRAVMILFFLLPLMSCGVLASDSERTRSEPLAQGYTPCNELPGERDGVICHPNQYCQDPELEWCFSGCLSDDNCSHEQLCVKNKGANVGNCIAADELPDREPDLEPGYTQCGDPTTPARYQICQPSQHCGDYGFGHCFAGCLSEYNCTEQQVCEKQPGENVGVCVNR